MEGDSVILKPKNDFRIEGDVVWIKLTQGKETCVDLADWPRVSQHRWFAHKCRKGFRAISRPDEKTALYMHRLLVSEEGLQTDHRDGNGLNNRRYNLRPATHAQNQRNRGKTQNNKSGFKGVRLERGRWRAQVRVNSRAVHIGCYSSAFEAAVAHDEAVKKLHGEFARLNFPEQTFTAGGVKSAATLGV